MTRPQRVRLARTLFGVGVGLCLWVIWSQRLWSWTAAGTGGVVTREFGLVHYLTIKSNVAGSFANRGAMKTLTSDWNWRGGAVALNAGISVVIALALAVSCRRVTLKDRLVGRCDECGYDLTGLHSQTFPECGAGLGTQGASR